MNNFSPQNTAWHLDGLSADGSSKNRHVVTPQGLGRFILTVLALLVFSGFSVDMNQLAEIESGNNPNVASYKGWKNGIGLYQISDVCRRHYNEVHSTHISPQDLYNAEINESVATWYIKWLQARPSVKSIEDWIVAWNWGIGHQRKWAKRGRKFEDLPKETQDFIRKYRKGV